MYCFNDVFKSTNLGVGGGKKKREKSIGENLVVWRQKSHILICLWCYHADVVTTSWVVAQWFCPVHRRRSQCPQNKIYHCSSGLTSNRKLVCAVMSSSTSNRQMYCGAICIHFDGNLLRLKLYTCTQSIVLYTEYSAVHSEQWTSRWRNTMIAQIWQVSIFVRSISLLLFIRF